MKKVGTSKYYNVWPLISIDFATSDRRCCQAVWMDQSVVLAGKYHSSGG